MGCIYYKQLTPNVLTFFVVNTVTRNIEGMFREYKTENAVHLIKNLDTSLWNDIDHNDLAKSFIEASVQITQEEYEAAQFIINAMIDTDYWYTSEDKVEMAKPIEKKEVVAETVYC